MINKNKLKSKIVENGFTQESLSEKMGISRQSFNSKLNNKVEFRVSEIESLCEILKIDDVKSIFFG